MTFPAATTETEALARLPGGELRYVLRRSPRSRRLRVTIVPDRGVVVSIPPAARRGWARPEPVVERVPRRARGLDPPPPRDAGGLPGASGRPAPARGRPDGAVPRAAAPRARRRGAARLAGVARLEGGRRCRRRAAGGARGARPPARGGDPRGVVPRPGEGRHRGGDRPPRAGARGQAGPDHDPRHHQPLGQLLAHRQPVVLLAPRPRAPEALDAVAAHELCHLRVFGHGPGSSPCSPPVSRITGPGDAGCGDTRPSCTPPSTEIARSASAETAAPACVEPPVRHGRMSLDSGRRSGNHLGVLRRH